jgi:hypothetical protein
MGYNETPYGRNIMNRIKALANHPAAKIVATTVIITLTVQAVDLVGRKLAKETVQN